MRARDHRGAKKKTSKPGKLLINEKNYRRLFELNPIPMWVYDLETLDFLAVNDAAILHYGHSRQEFLAMKTPAILSEKDVARPARVDVDAAIDSQYAIGRCRYRKKDGQLMDVEVIEKTLRFEKRPARLVLSKLPGDATRVAEDLRASERNYRQLFDNAGQGIWVLNQDGKTIMANRCLAEILGCPLEEMLGASWFAMMDEPGREEARRKLERVKQGIQLHHDLKFIRKDGTAIDASLRAWPRRNESGEFIGTVAFVADATKRKRDEADLKASECQLRAVFDCALDPMAIANDEERFLDANPAACELFGSSRHELMGRRMGEFSEREVDFHRDWRALLELGVRKAEFRLLRPDGTVRQVEFSVVAEVVPGRHLSALRDVTEQKRVEKKLQEISGRLLRLQDEQRRRIARQLHDSIAQTLSASVLNLNAVRKSAARMGEKARQAFTESVGLAQQCSRELRSISYVLHPPLLDDLGLAAALRHYLDGYTQRSGIPVKLDVGPEVGRLPQAIELALYRVVQESLNLFHSRSGKALARVRVARDAEAVTLEIKKQVREISDLIPIPDKA